MDKVKIMRLLDEANDIVSALYRQGANKDYKCKMLREKLKVISAEISTPPKSNADRIRQMTDDELAELITNRLTCSMCCNNYEACITFAYCKDGVLEWLQTEAREDEQS